MSLLQVRPSSLISFLREREVVPPPLTVIDVGCSGGLNPAWRAWGDRLSGLGVDVLVDEVERLTAAETNPAVRYVAARAGLPGKQSSTVSNYALHRSQGYLATMILGDRHRTDFQELWREAVGSKTAPTEANYSNVADPMADPFFAYYARHFAQQSLPRMTDRSATLDELWDGPADMLKIDTDGWDFDVLQGAERVLGSCLAVEIEAQFHGPVSPTANVFCNIDAFLRERGFSLFRLAPVHYARSALPKPFLYDIPANNQAGQITWADALYVRDLAGKDVEDDRLRTLALILDLYELEDAAAEILLSTPGLIEGGLDFLARKVHGVSYREVTDAFIADPVAFHRRLANNSCAEPRDAGGGLGARVAQWTRRLLGRFPKGN